MCDEETLEMLDWNDIQSNLNENDLHLIKQVHLVATIDSTNNWALKQASKNSALPAICIAEQQTSGRGRKGREWVSPFAQNIYMSIAWRFKMPASSISGLGLAVGVGIARWLELYGINARLKWPNDVLVNQKKLAGVLVESKIKSPDEFAAIIGVGLNFDMQQKDGEQIDQQWTDICSERPELADAGRNKAVAGLLSAILSVCREYEKKGLAYFYSYWQSLDICAGREVMIDDGNEIKYGIARGINEEGALIVEISGKQEIVYAADVSIQVNS